MTEQAKHTHNQADSEQEQKNVKPAKGLFRLSGLAALVATVGVLGGGTYLFADSIAKTVIKQSMQVTFGAQTDLEQVTVNWSPFGIVIEGLAQTDAKTPTQNLFAIERASAQVDLWEWLLGNYVIEQAQISKLMLGSARSQPGTVYRPLTEVIKAQKDQVLSSGEEAASIALPSADEILARLDLQTEKKGRALEQTWQTEKPKLEKALAQLPNKAVLSELKADWKTLTSNKLKSLDDIQQLERQLTALKAKIDQQKQGLKQAKVQYKDSKAKLDKGYAELKQAAKDDWAKVEAQVSMQNPNAVAIAKLLFGPEVAGYLNTAQQYWQQAQPYLAQHKAEKEAEQAEVESRWDNAKDIEYTLDNPYPSWLIRELDASILLSNQLYQITGSEINTQSYVRNLPTNYRVNLAEQFTLTGQYFVDQAEHFTTEAKWQITGMPVQQKTLSDSSDLTLALTSAKLNGSGRLNYDKQISSASRFGFTETTFNGKADTKLAKLTLDTLSNVSEFDLQVAVSGQLQQPDIEIKSDLDKQLTGAFKSAFNAQWANVKADTRKKLDAKLKAQFNLDDTELAQMNKQLEGVELDFDSFGSGSVEDIIKQQTKAFEDKLKDKAKDKLKEKLKGFFGNE